MSNLGSSSTPVSGESFDLPSGWSFEENANGEVIITDSGGTTIGRRDETNGKWVFDSIVSDTLEAGGFNFIGEFQTLSDFDAAAESGDRGYITDEQQFARQS